MRSLPATTKKVLIVEDIAPIQQVLRDLIERSGQFEVCGVSDSQDQATRLYEEHAPDAVVLDLHLKQGSGLGVLRSIRSKPRDGRVFVVVVTTHTSASIRQACLHCGADAFLDKNHELLDIEFLLHAQA